MTKIGALSAVGAAAAIASQAGASVYFTFDDPSTAREVSYMAPPMPGPGTMSYNNGVVMDFVVDATEEGFPAMPPNPIEYQATLTKTSTVGAVTQIAPGTYIAPTSGTFEFRRSGDNALILSGSYSDATMVVVQDAGAVIASETLAGGSLTYTAGPAMLADLGPFGILGLIPEFDAVWTMTALSSVTVQQDAQGNSYFGTFWANAAFTGTSEVNLVPTPSSVALATAGGLFMMPRRRRKA